MPKYRFLVVTAGGSRIEAESEADSLDALRERMAARGCSVEKVETLNGGAAAPEAASPPLSTPAVSVENPRRKKPAEKPPPETPKAVPYWPPVIRQCANANTFLPSIRSGGVALYGEGVVMFTGARVSSLAPSVLSVGLDEGLKAVSKVKIQNVMPWDSIDELIVRRHGRLAGFHAKAQAKRFVWNVPLAEAQPMVEGCHHFLQGRFDSTLEPGDFAVKPPVSRQWIVLAVILLAVGGWAVGWKFYGRPLAPPDEKTAAKTPRPELARLTVDEALARHAEVTYAGKTPAVPYQLQLSPGWKANMHDDSGTFLFQNGSDAVFGVYVLPKKDGKTLPDVGAARTALEALVYGQKPDKEDERAWLRRQQGVKSISQFPTVMRDGRKWTAFKSIDGEGQREWRAEFTSGPGSGFLVFGWSPISDADGKMRSLVDAAFKDFSLPPPAPEDDRQRLAARAAVYRAALQEPKAVVSQAKDPAFSVALGKGWRELPLDGGNRLFLMDNNAALSFRVEVGGAMLAPSEARAWFFERIGRKDRPNWPIVETTITKADGRTWRELRAETEEQGVHAHWRSQWSSDLENSYLLISRTWDEAPEVDTLAGQLLDQAFANFTPAAPHLAEYRGGARPYVFRLAGEWSPLDLSANGFDKAWQGPGAMILRVETGAGSYTPDQQPAMLATAREDLAKKYLLGPASEHRRWVRFRADIDIEGKTYACFFSFTLATDAYYMVSVLVPTSNLDRCEPVLPGILDGIVLPAAPAADVAK